MLYMIYTNKIFIIYFTIFNCLTSNKEEYPYNYRNSSNVMHIPETYKPDDEATKIITEIQGVDAHIRDINQLINCKIFLFLLLGMQLISIPFIKACNKKCKIFFYISLMIKFVITSFVLIRYR